MGDSSHQTAFRRRLTEIESGWLACLAAAADAGRQAARPLAGTVDGRRPLGLGGGGDITIELDRAAEEAVLSVIDALAPAPHGLVLEERGMLHEGRGDWVVLVDPVDGSLNAKRGLPPFSVVLAVADGPSVSDVAVSYTLDCVTGRGFAAVRDAGLAVTREWGSPWSAPAPPALPADDSVEIVLIEAGRPAGHDFCYSDLARLCSPGREADMRVRQIGSLGLSLCHIALCVADILVAPVPSRAVDIAAGLRLVVEAAGGASGLAGRDLWSQPLDLERRTPFVAWRPGLDAEEVIARAEATFGRLGAPDVPQR